MAVDRLSPNDVTELVTETPACPMQIAAVLRFAAPLPVADVEHALDKGVARVPALRRRLQHTPIGLGRPVWVDDAAFDLANHVRTRVADDPASEQAVLDVAASASVDPLPRHRPLWSATLVTDRQRACHALVLVAHHVITDGIGGLSALGDLFGDGPRPTTPFPRPAPSRRELLRDRWARSRASLRSLPDTFGRLRDGVRELRGRRGGRTASHRKGDPGCRAARTSLNRPIGPQRRLRTARVGLSDAAGAARRHDASINELVLAAVAGALSATVRGRGERVEAFVVSVPVSSRTRGDEGALGNRVGVMPVCVPAAGPASMRLSSIAGSTRAGRGAGSRGSSASLLGAAFRLLAQVGLFGRLVDRQRMVNTFVTNLHGPGEPLVLDGIRIDDVIAVSPIAGNVTVAFAALSYAGHLTITVIGDPGACPDLDALADALQGELDALVRVPSP